MTTIYRAETIGSLLRPTYLKEARRAWRAGALPTHEFKRVEDRPLLWFWSPDYRNRHREAFTNG